MSASKDSDFVTNVYDMPRRSPTSRCVRPASSLAAISLARKAPYAQFGLSTRCREEVRRSPIVSSHVAPLWWEPGHPSINFVLSAFGCLVDGELAIRAVRNHRLTRLKVELGAIELDRDDVRFERHKVGNAADFGIGVRI